MSSFKAQTLMTEEHAEVDIIYVCRLGQKVQPGVFITASGKTLTHFLANLIYTYPLNVHTCRTLNICKLNM